MTTGMSDADNVVSNCEVMRETEKQFSPGETSGRERDHMTARLTWALATVQLPDPAGGIMGQLIWVRGYNAHNAVLSHQYISD